MGTRSGDLDPAILDFIAAKEGLSLSQVEAVLNKSSGLLGISGLTNDMRDLLAEERELPAGRARLASVLLARHAFAEALDLAEEAAAVAPGDAGVWALLYDAAFAAGRYDRAAEALTRLGPGSVTRRLKSAFWLEAQGRLDAAHGELAAACRRIATWSLAEQEAFCWTELGHLERGRGDSGDASALYARALRVEPGYRAAVEGLADLAAAEGDRETAEGLYRRIATDAHPDLYLRLAELRRARGDSFGATRWERSFLRVATAPGAEPMYGRWLALLWAEHPETRDAALAVARRDLARRPAVESWDALAWVHYRRGEMEAAIAASDRALSWGSPSPTIAYHRARILEALGRDMEAARWLERATEVPGLLDPAARIDLAALDKRRLPPLRRPSYPVGSRTMGNHRKGRARCRSEREARSGKGASRTDADRCLWEAVRSREAIRSARVSRRGRERTPKS